MNKTLLLLIVLIAGCRLGAQSIICSEKDQKAVISKINEVASIQPIDFGNNMVQIGKTFLGTPYVAQTLEVGTTESLVINLQGLDCTTYVENVLAFNILHATSGTSFESFVQTLEKIRYRDGALDGYGSRLHYFSDWIRENEKKGLVKDITSQIGGEEVKKVINFMSEHRSLYPSLQTDENYERIKEFEESLQQKSLCIIDRVTIQENEHLIQSGDIIALTTSIKGLDITHTGIATREADGRIHLLHASSTGEVEVSKLPLTEYLKKVKNNTGIIVARPTGN
ncbi:MAG: DUF1460 domain-containing protein [Muriicola sp.]|nr:DUF1460 domain-containing protein [Muriicola sp.]